MGKGKSKKTVKTDGNLKASADYNPYEFLTEGSDGSVYLRCDVEVGIHLLKENLPLTVPSLLPEPFSYPCFGCNKAIDNYLKDFKFRCTSCGIPVCDEICAELPAHKNYECQAYIQIKKKDDRKLDKLSDLIADVAIIRIGLNSQSRKFQEALDLLLETPRVLKYRRSEEFQKMKDYPRNFFKFPIKFFKSANLVLNLYSIIKPNMHTFPFDDPEKGVMISIFSLIMANCRFKKDANVGLGNCPTCPFGHHSVRTFQTSYTLTFTFTSHEKILKGTEATFENCRCLSCASRVPKFGLCYQIPILVARRRIKKEPILPIVLEPKLDPKSATTSDYYKKFGFEMNDSFDYDYFIFSSDDKKKIKELPPVQIEPKPICSTTARKVYPRAKPKNSSLTSLVFIPNNNLNGKDHSASYNSGSLRNVNDANNSRGFSNGRNGGNGKSGYLDDFNDLIDDEFSYDRILLQISRYQPAAMMMNGNGNSVLEDIDNLQKQLGNMNINPTNGSKKVKVLDVPKKVEVLDVPKKVEVLDVPKKPEVPDNRNNEKFEYLDSFRRTQKSRGIRKRYTPRKWQKEEVYSQSGDKTYNVVYNYQPTQGQDKNNSVQQK